jgi:hypothetical protein
MSKEVLDVKLNDSEILGHVKCEDHTLILEISNASKTKKSIIVMNTIATKNTCNKNKINCINQNIPQLKNSSISNS